jgi:Uncharacterized protein conserved in bacteria (DUF2188)
MANTRYVRKSSTRGGWDVVKEGHARATSHARTKRAAVREAAKAVRREGGGEVRVLNRTGKITDANTVRPRRKRAAA